MAFFRNDKLQMEESRSHHQPYRRDNRHNSQIKVPPTMATRPGYGQTRQYSHRDTDHITRTLTSDGTTELETTEHEE